jgi:hypothetical protein
MITLSKKLFYLLTTLIFLTMSLSSCEMIKEKIGLGAPKDIPLGEYIGTATPIESSTSKPAASAESGANGESAINAEPGANPESKEVKINFLPKESGFKDAIGILVFENISDRFLWRSDGNNNNIWNIMFTKDNTIYSNLQDSFEFSGVIKSSEERNTLEGKLTWIINEKDKVYYFKAAQIFQPSIEVPKEPIAIKAGEEIIISATKLDPEKIKVFMEPLDSPAEATDEAKKEDAKTDTTTNGATAKSAAATNGTTANGTVATTEAPVAISNAKEMLITNKVLEKGVHKLTFASSKDQAKGKYKVSITREDGEKSNTIIIEIK